ncbi:MAG: nucleotidyltransferase family protein [Calditrichaceae bacterium]|jgi:molybdenum cofactor cytidylyltransferase
MISGILLAAGESSRMGRPKALLPYEGITFIDSILNKFAETGCEPIITILGSHAEMICEKTKVNSFHCFNNPHPEDGQLSSLKIAVKNLPENSLGFILALVDHPMVKLDTYRKLFAMAQSHPGNIIIPEFLGQKGHPVFFGRPFFNSIMDLPLSDGARMVIRENPDEVKFLPVDDEGILKDIDTPDEYRAEFH